jgi:hypothetical protein
VQCIVGLYGLHCLCGTAARCGAGVTHNINTPSCETISVPICDFQGDNDSASLCDTQVNDAW